MAEVANKKVNNKKQTVQLTSVWPWPKGKVALQAYGEALVDNLSCIPSWRELWHTTFSIDSACDRDGKNVGLLLRTPSYRETKYRSLELHISWRFAFEGKIIISPQSCKHLYLFLFLVVYSFMNDTSHFEDGEILCPWPVMPVPHAMIYLFAWPNVKHHQPSHTLLAKREPCRHTLCFH